MSTHRTWSSRACAAAALRFHRSVMLALAVSAAGCGTAARLPVAAGMGPRPELPPPTRSLIPTVNVVSAKGWSGNATPVAAEGTTVTAFARGLDHPRWLYVLPNGDVLVAETNAPPRPEDGKGITDGRPSGLPMDVLTGFVTDNGDAMGRPVGVVIDKRGALLVADDVGNTIWRVAGSSAGQ